jgi:AMP-binding enzyme
MSASVCQRNRSATTARPVIQSGAIDGMATTARRSPVRCLADENQLAGTRRSQGALTLSDDLNTVSFESLTPFCFWSGQRPTTGIGQRLSTARSAGRMRISTNAAGGLVGALASVARSRPVAVLTQNSHVILEAHFGVPGAGVPLVTLSTRLSPEELRYILEHSERGVLIHDPQFDEVVAAACPRVLTTQAAQAVGSTDDETLRGRSALQSRLPVTSRTHTRRRRR